MKPLTQAHPATAARDLLLRHRLDYPAAAAEFSWPQFGEFNWALDWFDVVAARHPGQEALRVVAEDGVTLAWLAIPPTAPAVYLGYRKGSQYP